MLAKVLEAMVQPISHLFVNSPGDTNATWVGQGLDASGDIHSFTVNIFAIIDDVAKIDAHAKVECAYRQPLLHNDSASNGILDCREFGQKAVACVLDDTPRIFGDGGGR